MTHSAITRTLALIFAPAFAFAACGGEPDQHVFLPLPPHEGARALVVGIRRDQTLTMLAGPLDGGATAASSAIERSFDDFDTFPIEALIYRETLEQLALPTGTLEWDDSADPLARPQAVFGAEVRDALPGAWSRLDRASEDVAAFRPKRTVTNRCPRFETVQKIELPTGADLTFLIPLAEGRVFLGMLDGTMVIIEPSGALKRITSKPELLAIGAAFIDEAGDLYFGGGNGAIWRGLLVETATTARVEAERFSTSGRDGVVRFMRGGQVGGGYELFTLDDRGHFYRLYGSTWTELYDFGKIEGVGTKGGVARLGPGHALAAMATRAEVIRFHESAPTIDSPPGLSAGVTAIGVTSRGVLISTGDGFISRSRAPGVWESLGQSKITVDVYAFLETAEGFLYAGALGYVAEWNGAEFCEAELVGSGSVRAVIPFQDGFLLGEDKPFGHTEGSATFIRRVLD